MVHTQEVAGSNPAPATNTGETPCNFVFLEAGDWRPVSPAIRFAVSPVPDAPQAGRLAPKLPGQSTFLSFSQPSSVGRYAGFCGQEGRALTPVPPVSSKVENPDPAHKNNMAHQRRVCGASNLPALAGATTHKK